MRVRLQLFTSVGLGVYRIKFSEAFPMAMVPLAYYHGLLFGTFNHSSRF